jgi:phenylalanine-4-hydroxylase
LVLSTYSLYEMKHYKHFNNLLRYLTRVDYPLNYPQLHHFVLGSLRELLQLMQHDVKAVIQSSRVMAVLSTCKVVLKEYNLKKVTHSE